MNETDLNELDQEPLNDERLRRMKALMRQLYREEFETKAYKLPPIKGKTLILFVSFLSIIVFGVTTLYNYNRFITLEEKILSAKGQVEAALQYRSNLFSNLFNLALNHADVEREVFHYVARARAKLSGGEEKGEERPKAVSATLPNLPLQPSDLNLPSSVARLLAIVEQYPDVKSSTTYQQLMDKLVEMEDRVAASRNKTHEAIRVYNTLISTFPWYVLSKATGFSRHEYYTFDMKDTLLSADVFDRLLPRPDDRVQRVWPTKPAEPTAPTSPAAPAPPLGTGMP